LFSRFFRVGRITPGSSFLSSWLFLRLVHVALVAFLLFLIPYPFLVFAISLTLLLKNLFIGFGSFSVPIFFSFVLVSQPLLSSSLRCSLLFAGALFFFPDPRTYEWPSFLCMMLVMFPPPPRLRYTSPFGCPGFSFLFRIFFCLPVVPVLRPCLGDMEIRSPSILDRSRFVYIEAGRSFLFFE